MEEMGRDQFFDAFAAAWGAQQHVAMIGPTGRGKSTVAKGILARRPGRQVILCPKGPDPTLEGFGNRVKSWPPSWLTDTRPTEGGPIWDQSHFVKGFPKLKDIHKQQRILRLEPSLKSEEDFAGMEDHFRRAILDAWKAGVHTIYVDELGVAAVDLHLYKLINMVMVTGRSKGTVILSAVQAPRNVPRSTYDQSQHVLLWRQRDKEGVKRISEISGVDTDEVKAAVQELDYHAFLWVDAIKDELTLVRAD